MILPVVGSSRRSTKANQHSIPHWDIARSIGNLSLRKATLCRNTWLENRPTNLFAFRSPGWSSRLISERDIRRVFSSTSASIAASFAASRGRMLLNTFSYTCAFGVAAAIGGAATVNLDLSRNYLSWGKRNYELNQIDLRDHEFLYGDVFDWLGRFKRRGRKFDLIILDPPTFSRDRRSRVFRVQDDFGGLADRAAACLNRNGLLLCSTNFRGMTFSEFLRILRTGIDRPFETVAGSMPPDFTGDQYLKTVWLQF